MFAAAVRLQATILLLLAATTAHCFYLPGIAPKYYKFEDSVPLQVNVVQSTKSLLPYDFYNPRFHFCKPDVIQNEGESLGSVLMGDRIFNSKFEVKLLSN